MYGEKRARQIEYKARKQRESLAGVSNTAPLNVQVRLRAYCMIWELKQKYYKADTPLPYVSKASHKADEERIKSLEAKIIKGGSDEERAVKAVAEDIIRVRERIANDPDYTEISCNDEARMLGCGSNEPVGGRDHSKHIEELKRKYGGDEDPEYSDLDRKLIAKMKQ